MKRQSFLSGFILATVALLSLLTLAAVVLATDGYDLSWWTVDGGGCTFLTGGGYSLGGTAGQPDAGLLTGGGYTLGGGFWKGGAGASPVIYKKVYLPLVRR